jgi:putative ABC transport system permease protein
MTWRNLYRQPVRTSLTVIGVSVGVVAIVAFSSIARGFWKQTEAALRMNESDLTVFQSNVASDMFSVLDEAETREKLLADPDVTAAEPALWQIMPVADKPFLMVVGLNAKDYEDDNKRTTIKGRRHATDDEVMIGSVAERSLKKTVGDTIKVRGVEFKITGVFQTDVIYFDGGVAMNLPALQQLLGKTNQVTNFQLRLREGADVKTVAARLEEAHAELVAIGSADQYKKVDQGLEMTDGLVWVLSFLAIVIGSVVVANTMWMTVLERTREIGVLRAVGWPRRSIMTMIVVEAAGVGLLACVVGSVLGAGLAQMTTWFSVTSRFIQPVFDEEPFLQALGVALVLSVLGGLVPAYRATRISPVEALRYE